MMRERNLLVLFCVLGALALFDVFTGWRVLPGFVLPMLMAAGIAGLGLAARARAGTKIALIFAGLITACFVVHLAYSILIGYEAKNWDRLAAQKATRALSSSVSSFNSRLTGVSRLAETISRRPDIVLNFGRGDRLGTFAELAGIAASLRRGGRADGIAVRGADGSIVAWAGDLPNYLGEAPEGPPTRSLDLRSSTAYCWIEAHAPIRSGGAGSVGGGAKGGSSEGEGAGVELGSAGTKSGRAGTESGSAEMESGIGGWVSVFKAIDARYPGVLPGEFAHTLSEDFTRKAGHHVTVGLGRQPWRAGLPGGLPQPKPVQGSDVIMAEVTLPDGKPVGYIGVRPRSLDDEKSLLTNQGLFVASILILVIICSGAMGVGRRLVGVRFSKASPRNLVLFLAVVWGGRLGFAGLRDYLHLGNLRAFTSYDYATQIPTGILRSPADLAITGVVAGLSLVIIILARLRALRSSESSGASERLASYERVPHFLLGIVAGLGAGGATLIADFALRGVLADSSTNPFTLSPFDFRATAVVIKAGIFSLSVACLLLGAALVAWQISALRRFWRQGGARNAIIVAAIVVYAVAGGAALAGRGAAVLVAATVSLAAGFLMYGVFERRFSPGFVSLVVGFALAASVVQFPYAMKDFYAKQRETIESAGARITARTDEWKISVLEEAMAQIAQDEGIKVSLSKSEDDISWDAAGNVEGSVSGDAERSVSGDVGRSAGESVDGRAGGKAGWGVGEKAGGDAGGNVGGGPGATADANPAGRLDSEALRLWASSILSSAHVACGVHILDRNNQEIGRFSLEDVGDLAEIESSIRAARFAPGPTTFVARGTFGGKDTDLYIGVAPLVDGTSYRGSIVVSIPYFYNDLKSMGALTPTFFEAIGAAASREVQFGEAYAASLISNGRVIGTTAKDLDVGSMVGGEVARLADLTGPQPRWIEQKSAGGVHAFYPVPLGRPGEVLLLSHRLLSLSERAVYLMSVILANMLIAIFIIVLGGVAKGTRHVSRRIRGLPRAHFRWSFATKLALAFLVIAIVPTLILGAASRGFLRARLREVMESKAEESLNLSRLALQRLVEGEAVRLARNPILMDELKVEPSILGVLVSNEISAAVADTSGHVLAAFGDAVIPEEVFASVTREGRTYNSFSAGRELLAKSAVPIRDVIFPDKIAGCAFVSRAINEGLTRRLASDLNRDITFYGEDRVAASSKQELFVSEIMPMSISSDAYVDCFLRGRELHFTWQRIGNVDLVIGYSPLRAFDGKTVGAISVPLVFRKDDVGQRMEWTSSAISYLVAIVIGSIFVLGLVLARKISDPIRELIRGTLRASSGDLGFTIPRASDDEIGDLVSSFNRMTAALDKSRNALTERKRYIETIIGNVGAGIISTDWKGRVDTFNSAAEQMLGVKAKHVRGRDAQNVLRKIGAASLASVLDDVEPGEGIARREVSLYRTNGMIVTMRAVASRVRGPRQRMMGKVIVFEDVTELIRSKKLIAWSEMARQVAHEIKNPLTPMKLSAQQILQAHTDGAGDFDKILVEGLATIVDQIESLRRIAVEFSQFSRMPERRLEIAGINDALEESLSQYERTIGGSVEIKKSLDPSNPRLAIDRDEIKRVFLNLIENAIQAMPGGGRLEIRSAKGSTHTGRGYKVSVTSRTTYMESLRDFVEVSFADSGTGISVENSAKLFEPNFSTKTHGTGLGLAISKGIMDAYGGEIVIESAEGVGTCVRVRLPLRERPSQQRRPQRRDNRRRHRPRSG